MRSISQTLPGRRCVYDIGKRLEHFTVGQVTDIAHVGDGQPVAANDADEIIATLCALVFIVPAGNLPQREGEAISDAPHRIRRRVVGVTVAANDGRRRQRRKNKPRHGAASRSPSKPICTEAGKPSPRSDFEVIL